MRLSNYERETLINFNEAEDIASVYTHSKALRRRLDKLSAERPEECRPVKTCHDGEAVEYYIPKKWIKVSPPRKMSDEQREKLRKASAHTRFAQKAGD